MSITPRHWQQVMDLTGRESPVDNENFQLQELIAAQLNEYTVEIFGICESADSSWSL